jgi:hypothetical protein
VTFFDLRGKELARYGMDGKESPVAVPVDKINQSAILVKITGKKSMYTTMLVL